MMKNGLLMLLLLLPMVVSAQKLSFRAGGQIVFSNQYGEVKNIDNVILQEVSQLGYSDKPDFGVFLGVNYNIKEKLSISSTLDYVSLGATFLSYDENERDPVFGVVEKIHNVKNPILGISLKPCLEILRWRGTGIQLLTGLTGHIKLPISDDPVIYTNNNHPRVSDVLSQVDNSIKGCTLYYNYGVSFDLRKISLNIFAESPFSKSFLSTVALNGTSYDIGAKRKLFRISVAYDIF
jgi:hypothetical protein